MATATTTCGGAAAAASQADDWDNVPDYEYVDVNTKAFHVGAFRDLWLERLKPSDYSHKEEADEEFELSLAGELSLSAETVSDLKAICRQRKRRQDYRESLILNRVGRHDLYADELFRHIRPHMTLMMTGSHTLANMRDAICCVSDLQVCGEFSSTPNIAPDYISKVRKRFIDWSWLFPLRSTTIEWAKSHNFPSYQEAKMEDTRFVDLTIKVGFPYLYCHQGDCEHLVIITDIRQVPSRLIKLSHRSDCLDKKLYPLLTHKHRVATRKCTVCHVFIGRQLKCCYSRWLTTNDRLAPCDPCLFCDKCFRMLHYDEKGNKMGDFLAYSYVDPGAFN
ncbi:hypothetical protein CRUP_016935 [Coryphaenoides rupestris]|nr:hypothetical protein CRUP_016935 [Coryphaenoides rupestris]